MPETRAAKRQKLESQQQKGKKRKKGKKKEAPPKKPKKPKTETPAEEPASPEEILKAFDLDPKFGACIGISRMDRWKRAQRFKLNPPEAVKQILEDMDDTDSLNKCLWDGRV